MRSVGGMLLLKVWKSNIRQHGLLWLTIKLFDYITHPELSNCYWCPLTDSGKSHQIIRDSLKVILTSSKLVCCVMWWYVVWYTTLLHCMCVTTSIGLLCRGEEGGGGTTKWVFDGVNCMVHVLLSPVSELVLGTVQVYCACSIVTVWFLI